MSRVSQPVLQLRAPAVCINRPNQPTLLTLQTCLSIYFGIESQLRSYCICLREKSMPQCVTKTNKLKKRRPAQHVLIYSKQTKKQVNKMDKVFRERLIRKVFLDYNTAADEINHFEISICQTGSLTYSNLTSFDSKVIANLL